MSESDVWGNEIPEAQGLSHPVDVEEQEEMGSEARSERAGRQWVRRIESAQDMFRAETLAKQAPGTGSATAKMRGWRKGWRSWRVEGATAGQVGEYFYQSNPNGMLVIDMGADFTVGLTVTDGGKDRPINVEPYSEYLSPIQSIELLHLQKEHGTDADPEDIDRIVVRAVHNPEFRPFNTETGTGLKVMSTDIVVNADTAVSSSIKQYWLELFHTVIIKGVKEIHQRRIRFWDPNTQAEVDVTENRDLIYNALRMKTNDIKRWVAALKIEGSVTDWLWDGRVILYGEKRAEEMLNEAQARIDNSGTFGKEHEEEGAAF